MSLKTKSKNLLTYSILNPQRKVLLEKLTVSQWVKQLPAFYGTRRFITAFMGAPHLSLFWARSIQFMAAHTPTPKIQLPEDTACVSISNYIPQEVIHFRYKSLFSAPVKKQKQVSFSQHPNDARCGQHRWGNRGVTIGQPLRWKK